MTTNEESAVYRHLMDRNKMMAGVGSSDSDESTGYDESVFHDFNHHLQAPAPKTINEKINETRNELALKRNELVLKGNEAVQKLKNKMSFKVKISQKIENIFIGVISFVLGAGLPVAVFFFLFFIHPEKNEKESEANNKKLLDANMNNTNTNTNTTNTSVQHLTKLKNFKNDRGPNLPNLLPPKLYNSNEKERQLQLLQQQHQYRPPNNKSETNQTNQINQTKETKEAKEAKDDNGDDAVDDDHDDHDDDSESYFSSSSELELTIDK